MPPVLSTLEAQLAHHSRSKADQPPEPEPEAKPPRTARKREGKAEPHPATLRQAQERIAGRKVHLGAWLHEDYKRGVLMCRAQTGEDVQQFFARVLNAEFKARNLPVVKS